MASLLSPEQTTLGELIDFLAPGLTADDLLAWPPDAFAVAASALALSSGYLRVTGPAWPPDIPSPMLRFWHANRPTGAQDSGRLAPWLWMINVVSQEWARHAAPAPPNATPATVPRMLATTIVQWISRILAQRTAPLGELATHHGDVVEALLQVLAAADQACVGAGLTTTGEPGSLLDRCNRRLLARDGASTLCRRVRREAALVLPKAHTPQSGATIRSLTHNLALCPATEVAPRWLLAASEFRPRKGMPAPDDAPAADPGLNLLIVPWPRRVAPAHFRAVRTGGAGRAGYFDVDSPCGPLEQKERREDLHRICEAAREYVGRIDGVVFPELALCDAEVEELARTFLRENGSGVFIAGVGTPGVAGGAGRNEACFAFNIGPVTQLVRQPKHHRWCLDRSQIEAYGLGGQLDPTMRWWENITLERRQLAFMPFLPSITAAVLICEDLARQEPASQLIRAVGPNLVVALLMDGPQLATRWPGRYATVLADDPGSSVLSVTSLGMAELCRPGGMPARRTVALWKDQLNGAREITLEPGAEAVVLSLTHDLRTEYSLDGRSDGGSANFLALNGVHSIFAPRP